LDISIFIFSLALWRFLFKDIIMEVCILGSGSRGNCLYVEHRGVAVIIDQGFSYREMASRLESRGLDASRIEGVFVSHEHSDHMAGVGVTARKLGIPVYATRGTLAARREIFSGDEKRIFIEGGTSVRIGDMEILPFTVSHDANEPVQYCLTAGKKKLSIATDLGFVSTLVEESLRNSSMVVIEANHDVEMLRKGPYPWELKQRILSRTGHLSNRTAAELLFNLCQQGLSKAALAHLSEENNRADLAEKEVRDLFESYDRSICSLIIALQNEATPIMEI
jgi:phosphoribosyl 1,2-cyclic phosphodiesterase